MLAASSWGGYILRMLFKLFLTLLFIPMSQAATVEDSLRFVKNSPDYIELVPGSCLKIDLRYASSNNFLGRDLYGVFKHAFLHHVAAKKLIHAAQKLCHDKPGHSLIIYDALRPRSVQYSMWDVVKGTDKQKYVANPAVGSIHNFGFALDLSIVNEQGQALDMGTEFDEFSPVSEPRNEDKYLKSGRLSQKQVANRRLLRSVMTGAGFIVLDLEWWHFNALESSLVRREFAIVE
jgi:D-alanyl-D-alanine dipeptidase